MNEKRRLVLYDILQNSVCSSKTTNFNNYMKIVFKFLLLLFFVRRDFV